MFNFHASSFTWESHPHEPDPFYKYTGGFVGNNGDIYQVRFNLQSACWIRNPTSGDKDLELFLGSPCRSEYTIADNNLFQIPSNEWRMAFSRDFRLPIARRPSCEIEEFSKAKVPLSESFRMHEIDIRSHRCASEMKEESQMDVWRR